MNMDFLNCKFKYHNCLEFVLALGEVVNFDCGAKNFFNYFNKEKGSLYKIKNALYTKNLMTEIIKPKDWCVVLMSSKNRRCHVGLFVNGKVLHTERARPVMSHDIHNLKNFGYYIEGFYE